MNDHNDRFQSRYAITVLKFGSSVLCGADGVEAIVQEVYRAVRQGQRVLAVVSAFPGATDGLLNMAHELFDNPEPTALARLVATGETTSAALLGPDRVSARKRRPEPLRVAILGLGTVGLGVYRRLVSETERFRIVGVGVRDRGKRRPPDLPSDLVHSNLLFPTVKSNFLGEAKCPHYI